MTRMEQSGALRTMRTPRSWPWWAIAVAGAVHGLLVFVSMQLFRVDGQPVAALWVPSGVMVSLLILTERRQWAALLLAMVPAQVLASVAAGGSVIESGMFGMANCGEAILVVVLLLRLAGPTPTFGRVRDVIWLCLLASGVGAAFSASLASATTARIGTGDPLRVWLLWASSAMLGIILVTPPVVALLRTPGWKRHVPPRRVEAVILTALLGGASLFLFSRDDGFASLPLLIVPYPILIWAALRLQPSSAQLLSLLLAAIAIGGTLAGSGPTNALGGDFAMRMVWTQAYLTLCVVSTQLVAAIAQDYRVSIDDLTAREARMSFVSTYAHDIISLVEPDASISFVSPASAAVLGRAPATLIGHQIDEFLHPVDADRVRAAGTALRTGRTTAPFVVQYRAKHADEHWVWLETTTALANEPGMPPGRLVSVTRDISERQRVDARLQQAQRFESLGTMAGGLAHDFNNVLQLVLAGIQDLRDLPDAHYSGEALRTMQMLEQTALKGRGTTRRLLSLGRDQIAMPEPVDVDTAIRAFVPTARSVAGRGIEIRTELHTDAMVVSMVPSDLDQILLNLVLNARDAMESEGTIMLQTRMIPADQRDAAWPHGVDDGPWIEISVHDSGPGVPAELRERVFEPFFSTKAAATGSGLGLATAYAAASRANGHVWCDGAASPGSVFRVVLPVRISSGADEQARAGPRGVAASVMCE